MSKNLLTIEAFAEWCERKPADEAYDYEDSHKCAVAQFLSACGFDVAFLGHVFWLPIGMEARRVPAGFSEASAADPQTFGALAKRLRSLSA